MGADKEICRICLEKVYWADAEDIDLNKLRNLIKANILPKWEAVEFKNHVICDTCVDNCRTVQSLQRLTRSSNGTLWNFQKDPLKYKKGDKFDLRLAPRFKDVPEGLDICRCCSEPTRRVAVYLYDSHVNLLPVANIVIMLRIIGITLANLDETLNPIMCGTCWQRLQVGYTFRLRLNLVTQKVRRYRKLHQTTRESKNDLNDILRTWHKLKTPELLKDEMPNIAKPTLEIKLKSLKIPQIKAYLQKFDLTISEESLVDNEEMPLLSPVIEVADTKKMATRKSSRQNKTPTVTVTNTRSLRKPNPTLPTVKQSLNASTRRTRSSMKNQTFEAKDQSCQESDYDDLLMVLKEEIVKPNRQPKKRKTMPVLAEPAHLDILTDVKDSSVQYTFERWNFDNETGANSDTDTDDEFVEGTAPLNNSNDKCPAISPEPDVIVDVDDYDDNPPVLELQEPCQQKNYKNFLSYSIEEKRFDTRQFNLDPQPAQPQKKIGLSVRTDLHEPPKTVEPLLINLNTMEVSNKPARAVQIHSNEVIVPKYQLRNSQADAPQQFLASKKQNPPNTSKPDDNEFRSGDRIVMSFVNRPIGNLKRQIAPEDGGSSLGKRPKANDNYIETVVAHPETASTPGTSYNQRPQFSTSNNRVSQPAIQYVKKPLGSNQKPATACQIPKLSIVGNGLGSQSSANRKPQPCVQTAESQSNNQAPLIKVSNPQTTRTTFAIQKTLKKMAPNVASTKSLVQPKMATPELSGMPTLTPYQTQKPQVAQKPPVNNPPPAAMAMVPRPTHAAQNSFVTNPPATNQNYPIVQKIRFLENGSIMLVDQPMLANHISESQTNQQKLVLQKVVNQPKAPEPARVPENAQKMFVRKLVPLASNKAKAPESVLLAPKPLFDCILISSDDEDEPNLPRPSTSKPR